MSFLLFCPTLFLCLLLALTCSFFLLRRRIGHSRRLFFSLFRRLLLLFILLLDHFLHLLVLLRQGKFGVPDPHQTQAELVKVFSHAHASAELLLR